MACDNRGRRGTSGLAEYGDIRHISVITPYMPVGDAQVRRFFEDCGFQIVALKGLKCSSPVQIAHVSEKELRDAIIEIDDSGVEAIVQVGTNLAMARLAGIAEFWIDIAINKAIYWHALRERGRSSSTTRRAKLGRNTVNSFVCRRTSKQK